MSDYIDTIDIEGVQYDIQDTLTKEQTEENAQKIEELENLDIYSLEEIQTAGRWVNNKPIYRKVFSRLSSFPVGNTNIPSGVSNIENIIKIDIVFHAPNLYTWTKPLLSAAATEIINAYFNHQTNNIVVVSSKSLADYTQNYLILEYTKTTD